MKEQEVVVDVIVMQDGKNPGFFSYMPHEKALEIQNNGGLSQASTINLRETPDRHIPESIKSGQTCITDIWVRLDPNQAISLN